MIKNHTQFGTSLRENYRGARTTVNRHQHAVSATGHISGGVGTLPMTPNNEDSGPKIDPNLKEQERGIVDAFARVDHRVVTTGELAEHVSLSKRHLRRRLDDLVDRGIIGTRKPGRDRLWWLETDVKEPITVQYPLLQFVRDKVSVQLLLVALGVGIIAVILTPAAAMSYAYNVSPPLISRAELLRYGLLASLLASGFLIAATVVAVVGWLFRYLGIDLMHIEQG